MKTDKVHAILGNLYWSQLGVDILAHEDAIQEIEQNSYTILRANEIL